MNDAVIGVPDLLRRFVPTPHSAIVTVRDIEVTLQTNDPEFVSVMQSAPAASEVPHPKRLLMTLVRDDTAPSGDSYLTFLPLWPLGTLSLGQGTVLAIDCERREVIGFIANPVAAERVANELFPILLDFLEKGGASERPYKEENL